MITGEKIRYRSLVVDNIRLSHGTTSIIGPNGSGKTSLLKLLAGIAEPESGTILIDGILPRQSEIGWVNEFPDRNILFGSVSDEIASPLRFRHIPCRMIDERVKEVMGLAGIGHLQNRTVQTLSGGEKILVALASSLVIRPQVLVLDEYDSHLDSNHAGTIAGIIRKSGIPYVIHCTQDMDAAASADMVLYLEKGSIVHVGTPDEVFASLDRSAFRPIAWRCRL
ncbi:energy-coupling factor ABC transporter ATP-binding protein [Methanoregula sp. PtaB.Bin085]|uniref:energy-coupling factor ABC transporter ATP-binding protein n=1 Tax=Methanoregula sp. PtaB.Bin085 TaxID=1811680 RepID=UPI0009C9AE2E|nr:ATP-binding cassette domain-containing protein [Methanoregula sp. PtaB.Bin085]OPX65465.1 MAG: Trehalose/maltose import ATP-binding protein MalK [Methanoregula sp. PtaB.Bin085]